ncbi:hypothetical protein JCM6882_004705 [Rhodosporidiobolus microsporus]
MFSSRSILPLALTLLLGKSAAQRANTFEILGEVGISPQQIFAEGNLVYIVDKTENNPVQINGHPAWAGYFDLNDNSFTPLDIVSNSFCAGGNVLANGSWVNIGGNAAIGPQGVGLAADSENPYGNIDGGKAVRLYTPCGRDSCEWTDHVNSMPLSRWYPTVETLPTGDVIILGGELFGSFVTQEYQNVPSYEFWPTRGEPVNTTFLAETMPANLYPLTWLLSNGQIFLQAGWQTTLLDYENNVETRLPNITHAQRPYPAGAGSTMLTLVPENDYQETIIFAGGVTPERDDWNAYYWHPIDTEASRSLVAITPLADNPTWVDLDDLPEPRTMGNLILLPDKRIFMCNGARMGSEGYGWDEWAAGQSYATDPVLRPAYLNTSAPAGQMWDTNLPSSEIHRMYHSVATLLFDGSIFIAGSNPNVDVITPENNGSYPYQTEFRVERFYPSYYDLPRPQPSGLPTSLSYGGAPFNFTLPSSSLSGVDLASGISIMVIRAGFSTHVMNMGQRAIELPHSYTSHSDGSATLHVSQLPPNAALYAPGPAMLFVVVNGVPSNATTVMIGSGQLGTQPVSDVVALPSSGSSSSDGGSAANVESGGGVDNGAESLFGSFVTQEYQNVPSYEFWPTRGEPVNTTFLAETMPANLYPLTWLLSNGQIFLQAGWQTTLLDYENNVETRLPNITHAQRPYPAGAGSTMLTLVPENDYQETIVFAGGVTPERDDWNAYYWHPIDTEASRSLVAITPLADNPTWVDLDDLPEPRTMGNLIILPDKRIFMCNGARMGSEGYGWDEWAAGQSYATDPVLRPAYLNTSAPAGQMWDTNLPSSEIHRMYHSVATLFDFDSFSPSLFIAGSNPNVDVITPENNGSYPYQTEFRVERFYSSYYDSPRPQASGLPTSLSYGGAPFNFTLPSSSLSGVDLASGISIMVIRAGFSTHVMNMGQRAIELPHSYTSHSDGSATLHVSQLPPNAALYAPGPAMLFVVVNGVPSNATTVMIGSGQLGTRPLSDVVALPSSGSSSSDGGSAANVQSGESEDNGAEGLFGSFVTQEYQNVPSYECWPFRGDPVNTTFRWDDNSTFPPILEARFRLLLNGGSSFPSLVATAAAVSAGKANTFEIVGHTGVSAQQLFLGNEDAIYIVDKVQNNEIIVDGEKGSHPAWATEYIISTNEIRPLDPITNSFCAGGNLLGNGSWLNNNAVSTGGVSLSELNIAEGFGAYKDLSGGRAARLLTPCTNHTCDWDDDIYAMPENRWYPHVETMVDGSAIIIGGELWGGFVNTPREAQSVPTFEFLPKRGSMKPKNMTFLLVPLTWLQLFIQADWQTTLFHPETYKEVRLPNVTHAQRTYPSGGGVAMMPLTPENNYEPRILMCGGMKPERDDWNQKKWVVIDTPGSDSCVSIRPFDKKPEYKDEESLPENRSMANLIILPDETIMVLNGASYGSEGYGWENWHDGKYGQSYARDPVLRPAIYNDSAPAGSRWNTSFPESSIARMYHSSATILPDGSVFIAGSSPSADVITEENNSTYPYKTEYRAERFYPNYYDLPRPVPSGVPSSVSYGGDPFDLTLPAGNVTNPDKIRVSLMRAGFSTHAYNAGMRQVVLDHSYTQNDDSSVVLHVAQVPPNPAIIAPGPAMLFVTVDGVPSVGKFVMVGSGKIEKQPTSAASTLPKSVRSSKAASALAAVKDKNDDGNNSATSLSSGLVGALSAVVGALALFSLV